MATFTAIRNKKQTAGAMAGVLTYVAQGKKTMLDGVWLVAGSNCVPQASYLEMMTTKHWFKKTDGRQFYHFVQSFSEYDGLTPQEANAIGLELAQKAFLGYEVVIATHVDTNHLHNHFVVNSVSCETGRKLHQNRDTLLAHRQINDEICMAHGLNVLEEPEKYPKRKRMKPGEYQAGLRADSWKLDLIQAINEALEYAIDRESFIENIEQEGCEVIWTDTRKHITFTCLNGWKCRDSSLHDETFLKENLEACLPTGRPWDSAPAMWSLTRIGWEIWPVVSFCWAERWNAARTCLNSLHRPHGQTASSAVGRR
ncbi:relaxase/mobilization nuclease domain-containing protein [Oscillospiraceae bacterium 50-60]